MPIVGSFAIVAAAAAVAFFYVADYEKFPFSLGLDLAGGAQITYTADTSGIPNEEIHDRIASLQQVIERRINALGVAEPRVYTVSSSLLTGLRKAHRLVIELPGVTDIDEAIEAIGKTPYLEFRILNQETNEFDSIGLQGGNIRSSDVQFLPGLGGTLTADPAVVLNFDREGGRIFADVTRENVGNLLGIFLDGVPISTPVIQSAILGGTTQITGNFTLESATELSNNLNFGALPLPIELSETQTVSPTLGAETVSSSFVVGMIAMLLIALLFLIVYRGVGLVAIFALCIYGIIVLFFFKSIPVVLTAAGLVGFIMSLGFAVDANVLIFERMREEIRNGIPLATAITSGSKRAWSAIRDGNMTSIFIAFLLFWFGTSLVKGFAFVFIIGVLVSMLSAYVFTRIFLKATAGEKKTKVSRMYIG